MKERSPADLERRIREADAKELVTLLQELVDVLDVPAARQALRNPFLTAEAVDLLLEAPRLKTSYEIQRQLAGHPRTPEVRAMHFVPHLYWRDLVRVGADMRIRPGVRRIADNHLVQRLPGLAVGEKMSIARTAGTSVLTHLRHDPSPRVMAALLENPRLTEGLLEPVVNRPSTPAPILTLIAESRRWGTRYHLRVGLCRNPTTPPDTALRLLPSLRKSDLKSLTKDPRLSERVRRRARVLLGDVLDPPH